MTSASSGIAITPARTIDTSRSAPACSAFWHSDTLATGPPKTSSVVLSNALVHIHSDRRTVTTVLELRAYDNVSPGLVRRTRPSSATSRARHRNVRGTARNSWARHRRGTSGRFPPPPSRFDSRCGRRLYSNALNRRRSFRQAVAVQRYRGMHPIRKEPRK